VELLFSSAGMAGSFLRSFSWPVICRVAAEHIGIFRQLKRSLQIGLKGDGAEEQRCRASKKIVFAGRVANIGW
jgi:hypothetical protein